MAEEIGGVPVVDDQLLTGSAVDGWDATSGTTGDAAYSGTGAGTKIAILKAILAKGGGGAVTEADGANVVLGSRADAAATSGTGTLTGIALLKGILTADLAPIPAGTNLVGRVGIDQTTPGTTNLVAANTADGGSVTIGAKADAAVTSPTASGSLIALTKGLLTLLAGVLGVKTAAGAVVAGSFAAGALADGADVAQGTSTDAPLAAAAGTGSASLVAGVKGLFNLLYNGTAKVNVAAYYGEFVNQAVTASGAGATVSGTSRANPTGPNGGPYAYFTAKVLSSVAGTLSITNNVWNDTVNVPASTPVALKVPAIGGAFTASFTNTSGNAGNVVLLGTLYSAA